MAGIWLLGLAAVNMRVAYTAAAPTEKLLELSLLRIRARRLWKMLDDIDTADDIAKDDDRLFRSFARKCQEARWDVLSGEKFDELERKIAED